MNNCLVTKLKSSVNNDSLSCIGDIIVDIYAQESPVPSKRVLGFYSDAPFTIKVISGDLYFTNQTGEENLGREITLNGPCACYISNGDGKISINSKYGIWNFNSLRDVNQTSRFVYIDVNNINYIGAECSNRNTVSLAYIGKALKGNISNLKFNKPVSSWDSSTNNEIFGEVNFNISGRFVITNTSLKLTSSKIVNSNCTELVAQYCQNVTGTLGELGKNVNFVSSTLNYGCTIEGCNIVGSIESYFESLWSKGIRSGISYMRHGGKEDVKFNNLTLTQITQFVGTFSSDSITLTVDSNPVATYNGSTWTYNS